MANNCLSVVLRGLKEDNGDIRFNDFIQQLDIINKALNETQKIYSPKTFAYFRVAELRHRSPAFIRIEAVPREAEYEKQTQMLMDRFFENLEQIGNGEYPDGFNYETFNSYKDITSLRDKKRIEEIALSRNGDIPNNLENLSDNIEKILGLDEYEIGSYTGMLEAINIHSNQNVFHIYPISHLPKLKCIFKKELRAQAISGVGHYVTAIGRKKYKMNIRGGNSYEMRVQKLIIHPSEDKLPKLSDLKGIAPDITGDKISEDFVRGLRNEW